MANYLITNTGRVGKSYEASNGTRIYFEPGERKELSTLPPEVDDPEGSAPGWSVQREPETKTEDTENEGGENS